MYSIIKSEESKEQNPRNTSPEDNNAGSKLGALAQNDRGMVGALFTHFCRFRPELLAHCNEVLTHNDECGLNEGAD